MAFVLDGDHRNLPPGAWTANRRAPPRLPSISTLGSPRNLKKLGVAKVTCVIKEGFAGDEIRDYSVGPISRGYLDRDVFARTIGVKRSVLGSVAEAVVRHSGDPVLISRAL